MSIPGSVNPLFLGASGQATGYQISRSLRFNSADSAYLSRTPGTAGNRKTFTWAGWVKRSTQNGANNEFLFESRFGSSDSTIFSLGFANGGFGTTNDALTIFRWSFYSLITTQLFRDTSAWYHIVLNADTTQATASNRLKLYVNGEQVTSFSSATYPALNEDLPINTTNAHAIGGQSYLDGYLADIHFIDGQALTPSSFGEFDTNGVWQPIDASGLTYGTNGFRLPFSDNSTAAALGTDTSGNGNDWTVNNLSVTAGSGNDSLVDSPTNYGTDTGAGGEVRGNYATLNPLTASSIYAITNGNLDISQPGGGASSPAALATVAVNSGKWYWEMTLGDLAAYAGAATISSRSSVVYLGQVEGQFIYNIGAPSSSFVNGIAYNYSTASAAAVNDVIGIALNFDTDTITFYKNGVSQGPFSSSVLGSSFWAPAFKSNIGSSAVFNFGQRPFAYTAPSGFKALTTANLPTPLIEDGSTVMDVALYTGNGSTQTISGLGFSPDFVWIKRRSSTFSSLLYDTVRGNGPNTGLISDSTTAEGGASDNAIYGYLNAFNSTGFALTAGSSSDYVNTSGQTYVAWTWDAGSSTVTNTEGSITSQVRANASAGFSIVTWTGTAIAATIGHGLNAVPEWIIVKARTSASYNGWAVYSKPTSASGFLELHTTASYTPNGTTWNNTAPTSAVFSTASWTNAANMVAYCFAPVAGYSSFGSYTGNGFADGPFVFTSLRPAFVLIKATGPVNGNWMMYDNKRAAFNLNNKKLAANTSLQENEGAYLGDDSFGIDFLSNGFKIRLVGDNHNASGTTYIYAAFAESPFQFSRAR